MFNEIEVHVKITGICVLVTTRGIPTTIALPDARRHAKHPHVAWLLFDEVHCPQANRDILKIPRKNGVDDPTWRYVKLEKQSVSFKNKILDTTTTIEDGLPSDPENPTENTATLLHWVADVRRLVKHKNQELDGKLDLVAKMPVPAGRLSTGLVVRNCIWKFDPQPPKAYKQALAEEVEWILKVRGETLTIALQPSGDEISLEPVEGKVTVWLGNTMQEDILPSGEPCDPCETTDEHFEMYYDILDNKPWKKPLPTKPARVVNAIQLPPSQNRRGSGHNCPPLRVEGEVMG